jgi:hypothetical protein
VVTDFESEDGSAMPAVDVAVAALATTFAIDSLDSFTLCLPFFIEVETLVVLAEGASGTADTATTEGLALLLD